MANRVSRRGISFVRGHRRVARSDYVLPHSYPARGWLDAKLNDPEVQ